MNQEFVLPVRNRVEDLKDLYCDSYKDVHGIKARWVYGMDLTVKQLEDMMDDLEKEYTYVREYEARQEAAAEKAAREHIQALLKHGARDVAMAIRWMHEAEDTGNDHRFLDYTLGTRYGFIQEVLEKGL